MTKLYSEVPEVVAEISEGIELAKESGSAETPNYDMSTDADGNIVVLDKENDEKTIMTPDPSTDEISMICEDKMMSNKTKKFDFNGEGDSSIILGGILDALNSIKDMLGSQKEMSDNTTPEGTFVSVPPIDGVLPTQVSPEAAVIQDEIQKNMSKNHVKNFSEDLMDPAPEQTWLVGVVPGKGVTTQMYPSLQEAEIAKGDWMTAGGIMLSLETSKETADMKVTDLKQVADTKGFSESPQAAVEGANVNPAISTKVDEAEVSATKMMESMEDLKADVEGSTRKYLADALAIVDQRNMSDEQAAVVDNEMPKPSKSVTEASDLLITPEEGMAAMEKTFSLKAPIKNDSVSYFDTLYTK